MSEKNGNNGGEPELVEVVENFVARGPDGIDYAFRRGDRVEADHWAVAACPHFFVPWPSTAGAISAHRAEHGLVR